MKHLNLNDESIFLLSGMGYMISAFSVLLLPFSGSGEKLSFVGALIGILFWIGILTGSYFFYQVWKSVKDQEYYRKVRKNYAPGWRAIFTSREAQIVDGCMIFTWILTILGSFVIRLPGVIMLIGMWLAISSTALHFLLNGRVYRYLCGTSRLFGGKHKYEREKKEGDNK